MIIYLLWHRNAARYAHVGYVVAGDMGEASRIARDSGPAAKSLVDFPRRSVPGDLLLGPGGFYRLTRSAYEPVEQPETLELYRPKPTESWPEEESRDVAVEAEADARAARPGRDAAPGHR